MPRHGEPRGWDAAAGWQQPAVARRRAAVGRGVLGCGNTVVVGVHGASTPVVSCVSGTWQPRWSPACAVVVRRSADREGGPVPSGQRMTQNECRRPKGGRKPGPRASGSNRRVSGELVGYGRCCPTRKGADRSQVGLRAEGDVTVGTAGQVGRPAACGVVNGPADEICDWHESMCRDDSVRRLHHRELRSVCLSRVLG